MSVNLRFKKRPVVIEAFQMTQERRYNNVDWPEWLHSAWNKPFKENGAVFPTSRFPTTARNEAATISIRTLEGVFIVSFGDWIIRGVQGELYPCKPDIFEATYEAVPEQPEQEKPRSNEAVGTLRRACHCLRLEVPPSIADDVSRKAEAVIDLLAEAREECEKLRLQVAEANARAAGVTYTNGQPTRAVYAVAMHSTPEGSKSFWSRVGTAHVNLDGSLTLKLDAIPLTGTLQVGEHT